MNRFARLLIAAGALSIAPLMTACKPQPLPAGCQVIAPAEQVQFKTWIQIYLDRGIQVEYDHGVWYTYPDIVILGYSMEEDTTVYSCPQRWDTPAWAL